MGGDPTQRSGRGEADFARFPRLAAWIYDWIFSQDPIAGIYPQIASDLIENIQSGRMLDVGTGPGRLLREVHGLRPGLELHGLDISAAMIRRARENLAGMPVALRTASVSQTDYPGGYFRLITCTGSFYLWDHPLRSLLEMERILASGGRALLYESFGDADRRETRRALQQNLAGASPILRMIAPRMLEVQLRLTYTLPQFNTILSQSCFGASFQIRKIDLAGLPIWVRIELLKPS